MNSHIVNTSQSFATLTFPMRCIDIVILKLNSNFDFTEKNEYNVKICRSDCTIDSIANKIDAQLQNFVGSCYYHASPTSINATIKIEFASNQI